MGTLNTSRQVFLCGNAMKDAAMHFVYLVETMSADNWCEFSATVEQQRLGASAIVRMCAAGCAFPASDVEGSIALGDLDGVYWRIAAGEHTETEQAFGRYDGFAVLNAVLNEIFNGECATESAS